MNSLFHNKAAAGRIRDRIPGALRFRRRLLSRLTASSAALAALLLLAAAPATAQTCDGRPMGRYDFQGGDRTPLVSPPEVAVPDNMTAGIFSQTGLTRLQGSAITPPEYYNEPFVVKGWQQDLSLNHRMEFTLTPKAGFALEMSCLALFAGSRNHDNMMLTAWVQAPPNAAGTRWHQKINSTPITVKQGDMSSDEYLIIIPFPDHFRVTQPTSIYITAATTNSGQTPNGNAELAVKAVRAIGNVVPTPTPPPVLSLPPNTDPLPDSPIHVWSRGQDISKPGDDLHVNLVEGGRLQSGNAIALDQYFLIRFTQTGVGSVSVHGQGQIGDTVTAPAYFLVYLRSGGTAGGAADRIATVTDAATENVFSVDFRAGDANGQLTTSQFNIGIPPSQIPATLVSNTANAANGSPFTVNRQTRYSQRFTTGAADFGYRVDTVQVHIEGGAAAFPPSVELWTVNQPGGLNPGRPSQKIYDLIPPDTLQIEALNAYTAPAGTVLNANTTYILRLGENGANAQFGSTAQTAETGFTGFSIDDGAFSKPVTGPYSDKTDVLIMNIVGLANSRATPIHIRTPADVRAYVGGGISTGLSVPNLPHPAGGVPPYTYTLTSPPTGSGLRVSTSPTASFGGRPNEVDLAASPITMTYTVSDSATPTAETSRTFMIHVTPARTDLVSNIQQVLSDGTLIADDNQSHSQAFTTGSNANGYGLIDIGVRNRRDVGGPPPPASPVPNSSIWTDRRQPKGMAPTITSPP